jgi:hypothetical protein
MFKLVIFEDSSGFYTWRLEGPAIRGNSPVHAVAPQSWGTKQMALMALSEVRMRMATAILVDNTRSQ